MNYNCDQAKRFGWNSFTGIIDKNRINFLQKHLEGKFIFDIGCGGGAFSSFLEKQGFSVVGIDCSLELILYAKQKYKIKHLVVADICNLPFRNKIADSSTCFDVLEHVDDFKAINELNRITKRIILFSVPRNSHPVIENSGLIFFQNKDKTHLREYSIKSLELLLQPLNISNYKIKGEIPIALSNIIAKLYHLPYFLEIFTKIFNYPKIYSGYIIAVDIKPNGGLIE
jgi:2-polyprenyl-3-methyl-5-hydroxy-6-metoxy-1,4-benzoquinol methylase